MGNSIPNPWVSDLRIVGAIMQRPSIFCDIIMAKHCHFNFYQISFNKNEAGRQGSAEANIVIR